MTFIEVSNIDLLVQSVSVGVMLVILLYGWQSGVRARYTHQIIIHVIFFFSIYKVVMHYLLPFLMRLWSNFNYVREDGIAISDLSFLYFIETISWVPWLLGFLLVANFNRGNGLQLSVNDFVLFRSPATKSLLVFLAIGSIPYRIVTGGFLADVDFSLPLYIELFKSLLIYGGPPSSVTLLVVGFTSWGWKYGLLGVVSTASFLTTITTRGAIIYSIVFMIFLSFYFVRNKMKLLMVGVLCGAPLFVLYFGFGGLPKVYLNSDTDAQSIIEVGISSDKHAGRSSLDEIEWRFGALTRMSVPFIYMYDRGDSAGINPIKHSLLGFLPRSINPNKPHPSTVDPYDFFSQGMYMIYREIYGANSFSMVEFSTGGHAYWEFGWIGVFVLPFISGIYVAMCAYYFQWIGFSSVALILVLFKPFGFVDPKIWVSDIVMQIYQIIMPLTLLVLLWFLWVLIKSIVIGRKCIPKSKFLLS